MPSPGVESKHWLQGNTWSSQWLGLSLCLLCSESQFNLHATTCLYMPNNRPWGVAQAPIPSLHPPSYLTCPPGVSTGWLFHICSQFEKNTVWNGEWIRRDGARVFGITCNAMQPYVHLPAVGSCVGGVRWLRDKKKKKKNRNENWGLSLSFER